jgi:RNA polymerase sigma-70 factor, ECF subfamily
MYIGGDIMHHSLERQQSRQLSTIHLMEPNKALEIIMDIYGEEIKRFIFSYTKNSAQAEDITQEVFVNVFLKLHTFNGNSSLRTWIYSIAINKCKDYFKSWHYRKVQFFGQFTEQDMTHFQSPERIVTLRAESTVLIKQVLSLPLKYREILLLYYYREFSLHEICELLEISETTAKSRLHRGRKKLKDVYFVENGEEA